MISPVEARAFEGRGGFSLDGGFGKSNLNLEQWITRIVNEGDPPKSWTRLALNQSISLTVGLSCLICDKYLQSAIGGKALLRLCF